MVSDNEILSEILNKEYNKKTNYYTTCLVPKGIDSHINGNFLKLYYTSPLTLVPLMNIENFEGWSMIIHRWGVFDRLFFDWDEPDDVTNINYQKFLYRVKLFEKNFQDWFSLEKHEKNKLESLKSDVFMDDKLILESIIAECWYFEMIQKKTINIPTQLEVNFIKDGVKIEINQEETVNKGSVNQLKEDDIFLYWQLIINRWAYLPTIPQEKWSIDLNNLEFPDTIKDLMVVGYKERNFPFPSQY